MSLYSWPKQTQINDKHRMPLRHSITLGLGLVLRRKSERELARAEKTFRMAGSFAII